MMRTCCDRLNVDTPRRLLWGSHEARGDQRLAARSSLRRRRPLFHWPAMSSAAHRGCSVLRSRRQCGRGRRNGPESTQAFLAAPASQAGVLWAELDVILFFNSWGRLVSGRCAATTTRHSICVAAQNRNRVPRHLGISRYHRPLVYPKRRNGEMLNSVNARLAFLGPGRPGAPRDSRVCALAPAACFRLLPA